MTISPDDEDLMDVVERVLTADTADLRELALIARADPRTFYIGTSLDGVDLRGQDLRGMLITDLDRTKVRIDADTRFDDSDVEDEVGEPCEPEVPGSLVLIASHRLWRLVARFGLQVPNARIYDPPAAALFARDCVDFAGAKLVICQRNLDEGWPWEDSPPPEGVVILVHDRRLDRPTLSEREENINYWQAPQILVPTLREDRPGVGAGAARFPTALKDAIMYVAADWKGVSAFVGEMPFSVFIRASGTPTSPQPWVQIYSWAVAFGVDSERGLRMGLPRHRLSRPKPNYDELLFERLDWQNVELPREAKFIAAALFGVEKRQFPREPRSYAQTITRVLQAQNWDVETLEGPSPTHLPRLRISNSTEYIDLRIAGADRPAKREAFTPARLTSVHPELNPVVVSEVADTATVVSRLANFDELYVSIRDLVDLDARGATIWTLIASLTKRVSRTGDYTQRTQFLAMLTLRAARRLGMTDASPGMLEDHLLQPDFFQTHRLRVLRSDWRNGELLLDIAMIETETTQNFEMIRYRLSVGPTGPLLL